MSSVIYTPAGRAREYAERALNLYTGCAHGCLYCYAPAATHTAAEAFHSSAAPRPDIIGRLERELAKSRGAAGLLGELGVTVESDHPPVLLCFTCDPYQPLDDTHRLARRAIEVLHRYGIGVHVLTKGGLRAARDFDLLGSHPQDAFASTLTFTDAQASARWEPLAASPADRLEALRLAHARGIPTWVSLEPVIDPEQSLALIRQTYGYVDLFKVGTLNHHPHAASIDWRAFARRAVATLEEVGAAYYLKRDLRRFHAGPASSEALTRRRREA